MELMTKIKLFDADTFIYAGCIDVYRDSQWKFVDVTNEQLIELARNMPLKGILHMLISLNIVYDIIPCGEKPEGAD
jgi:hypothetical protein